MFGISGTELLLIGVFAFIIFGPDKIPEIARTVSKAVNMFKSTQEDMERLLKAEMYGLDPDKQNSVFAPKPADAAPAKTSSADTPVNLGTTASSLYGIIDDEEEDEE